MWSEHVRLKKKIEVYQRESKPYGLLSLWYLGRESNPNLIFRRDLFYPLNYQGLLKLPFYHKRRDGNPFSAAKIQQLFANVKCLHIIFNYKTLFFFAGNKRRDSL